MNILLIAGIILVGLMDLYSTLKGGDNTIKRVMNNLTRKQKVFIYIILICGIGMFYLSEILYSLN